MTLGAGRAGRGRPFAEAGEVDDEGADGVGLSPMADAMQVRGDEGKPEAAQKRSICGCQAGWRGALPVRSLAAEGFLAGAVGWAAA